MRISSAYFFQTGLNAINNQQADLLHLFQQTASGKRMVSPADDPLGAAQAINLRQSQSLNERFAANREVLKLNLGQEENILNSATLLLQDIKTHLIEAGNGTLSDADRMTLADVLSKSKETMFGLANSTDGNGQYLFSGFKALQPAFVQDVDGSIRYDGSPDADRRIQADQTRQISTGDLGSVVFTAAPPSSRAYVTQAHPDNNGTGLISSPSITDPRGENVGQSFEIRFTHSSDPEPILQYGIYMAGDDDPINGLINYDPNTSVIAIPGGLQVSFSGLPQHGDSFNVEPAANPGPNLSLSVFDTLDSIIQALRTPTEGDPIAGAALSNTLMSAMQKIDLNYDQVLTVRSSVGARMQEIEAIDGTGSARGLEYAKQISNLEDVDYYTVSTQLELRRAALEAASLAFLKIQGTSLFNMGSR